MIHVKRFHKCRLSTSASKLATSLIAVWRTLLTRMPSNACLKQRPTIQLLASLEQSAAQFHVCILTFFKKLQLCLKIDHFVAVSYDLALDAYYNTQYCFYAYATTSFDYTTPVGKLICLTGRRQYSRSNASVKTHRIEPDQTSQTEPKRFFYFRCDLVRSGPVRYICITYTVSSQWSV